MFELLLYIVFPILCIVIAYICERNNVIIIKFIRKWLDKAGILRGENRAIYLDDD